MGNLKRRQQMASTAVKAFDKVADRLLPVNDENSELYRKLTGLWVAAGAIATHQTISWVPEHSVNTDPGLYLGTIAAAALPTVVAGVLWRQGWRSAGE